MYPCKFYNVCISFRGAEIPPPPNLGSSGRQVIPKIGGKIGGFMPKLGAGPVVNKQAGSFLL